MAANDELTRLCAENEVLEEEKHHLSVGGSMQAALEARKISEMKEEVAAWDKKIADLKKALAEKRRIKAELLSRVAALEAAAAA